MIQTPDPSPGTPRRVRFGVYEMDLSAEELWRSGRRVALAPQPARLLAHFVRHPGELVSHEDIRELLWPDGIVRDFEQGVHTAVRQVRTAIQDVATGSRFVETLPRKGYRFVAPVEVVEGGPATGIGSGPGSSLEGGAPAGGRHESSAFSSTADQLATDAATLDPAPQDPSAREGVATDPAALAREPGVRSAGAPAGSSNSVVDAEDPSDPRAGRLGSRLPRWVWSRLLPLGFFSLTLAVAAVMITSRLEDTEPSPPTPSWTRGDDPRTFVAVLPFEDYSEGERRPAVADGMTEELISCLGRVHPDRLGVIARTSVMQYADTRPSLATVAEELQVRYAIEGSVRVGADRVRVEVRLVDCDSAATLWSDGHWRPFGDLYALHNELAARIAGKLAIEVLPAEPAVVAAQGSDDGEAYAAYLEGREAWSRFDGDSLRQSVEHYQRAVEADPGFAQAWGAMAESWALLAMSGEDPAFAYGRAELAAGQALEVSESVPGAWNALGFLRLYRDWDWVGSDQAFRRAVGLEPGYAMAHHWYAGVLSALERHDEAIAQVVAAMELDPRSLSVRSDLAWYYLYADRHEEALREAERTLAQESGHGWAKAAKFYAHLGRGEHDDALELALEFQADAEDARIVRAEELRDSKGSQAALALLFEHRLGDALADDAADPFLLAQAFGEAGDLEQGMASLQRALEERHVWTTFARVDPRFDPLRAHPAFLSALEAAGLGGAAPVQLPR